MKGYTETDKGWKESWLIRVEDNNGIAYTDEDAVILTEDYTEEDRVAVEEFAEWYDLPIEW
jgi:hypothetical protein